MRNFYVVRPFEVTSNSYWIGRIAMMQLGDYSGQDSTFKVDNCRHSSWRVHARFVALILVFILKTLKNTSYLIPEKLSSPQQKHQAVTHITLILSKLLEKTSEIETKQMRKVSGNNSFEDNGNQKQKSKKPSTSQGLTYKREKGNQHEYLMS